MLALFIGSQKFTQVIKRFNLRVECLLELGLTTAVNWAERAHQFAMGGYAGVSTIVKRVYYISDSRMHHPLHLVE